MPHSTPLITTIVAGLGLAFILGALAGRLRISPLVGYLLAGVLVGPHTPGFVADQSLALELAEIGVILLMFGVGLHFSLADLLAVRKIAIPGAMVQIAVATLLGMGLAYLMGWTTAAGFVFGLALSVASTVVLLRALQERDLVETNRGRIAVGWLIVEDLVMVIALVMLPVMAELLGGADRPQGQAANASTQDVLIAIGITLAKVAAFVALMLVAGRRVVPWILHAVAHTGSREMFRLAVLALALGIAFGASELFGVSFALGAFFAGMILNESELSQRAAEESLPFRDAFAVLFFVSVGMLFNPAVLLRDFWPVLGTVFIIVVGKSAAAWLIVRAFRHPQVTALTISASLAQIGEFSFILASLGVTTGLLPERGRDLILAGAILSILVNPMFFFALDWMTRRAATAAQADAAQAVAARAAREDDVPTTALQDHAVLIGYGRVGSYIGEKLRAARCPFLVIEARDERVRELRAAGTEVLLGNAARPAMLAAANVAGARFLLVAIPEVFEAGQIVAQGRAANARLAIVARAHSDAEVEHLRSHGADTIIMGEHEIARAMIARVLGAASLPVIVPGPAAESVPAAAPAQADTTVSEAASADETLAAPAETLPPQAPRPALPGAS